MIWLEMVLLTFDKQNWLMEVSDTVRHFNMVVERRENDTLKRLQRNLMRSYGCTNSKLII